MGQDDAAASADPYSGTDGQHPSGGYLSSAVGVRISTATFGTGFNFCIGALCCVTPIACLGLSLCPSCVTAAFHHANQCSVPYLTCVPNKA